jgi:penicillin-binding protein 1A
VTPRAFREVRDNQGQTLWCREPTLRQRVIRAEHAKALKEMLAGAVRAGTGRHADPGFFAAGKTGTTDDYRDAWFIGFTDRFVVGVWLGNEKSTPMRKVTGGGLPAEIWRGIVREAHKLPRLKPGTRCAGAAPGRREARLLTGAVPR